MFSICPICNAPMIERHSYGSPHGVEEYLRQCSGVHKCVQEEFAYGNYQIRLGHWTLEYSHSMLNEGRERLAEQFALLLKDMKENGYVL